MKDPCELTATEAVRLIAAKRLSALELMESCLERIAAREGQTKAMAWFNPEHARRAATAALPGPLHGIPIGVKDVLDTADMPTQYGSVIWRDHRPCADSAAVAWARSAGGVVLGKTVTTEFAMVSPGLTTNPHNRAHTPGGSSSGSAAGTADGFFPLALATQTAGSTIRPAAFCGIVGYKPTFGMIPRAGMKLMAESLDTVGMMARSVADCALLAGALIGEDLGDPQSKLERPPRIGICRSPTWSEALPETQTLFERVRVDLARHGATVVSAELPVSFLPLAHAHRVVQYHESARSVGWEWLERKADLSGALLTLLNEGRVHPREVVHRAYALQETLRRAFTAFMSDLDVLVTPAAPGQAPEGLGSTGKPAFNSLWTSLHVPCVTVPAGAGPDGLPLGVQIVGVRGSDRHLLAVAQWVADALMG